jgi:hypothetical protein
MAISAMRRAIKIKFEKQFFSFSACLFPHFTATAQCMYGNGEQRDSFVEF